MGTRQTLANLEIQLANNTSGAITPETIRDLLATLAPAYGSVHRLVAAATTIGTPGTYVKAAGTSLAGSLRDFSMPSDGRLQYDGVVPIRAEVSLSISTIAAANNQDLGFQISKNGVVIPESLLRRSVSHSSDVGSITLTTDVELDTDDYLELYLTNETSTATITVQELHLYAQGMPL